MSLQLNDTLTMALLSEVVVAKKNLCLQFKCTAPTTTHTIQRENTDMEVDLCLYVE